LYLYLSGVVGAEKTTIFDVAGTYVICNENERTTLNSTTAARRKITAAYCINIL